MPWSSITTLQYQTLNLDLYEYFANQDKQNDDVTEDIHKCLNSSDEKGTIDSGVQINVDSRSRQQKETKLFLRAEK